MNTNRTAVIAVIVGLVMLLSTQAALAGMEEWLAEKPTAKPQTICPVLGGKISRDIYVDVNGLRIFLCCQGCAKEVKANPDKYIAKIRANGEEPLPVPAVAPKADQACTVCTVAPEPTVKSKAAPEPTIDTGALAILLKSGVPLAVFDARTGKYDDGRRIPGAKALAPTASAEQAAALIKTADTLVITYCANLQCHASHQLATQLRKLGYTNVIEYPKGIEGWAADGQAVEQASK